MNYINKLIELGFHITWKLIFIGYHGDEYLSKQMITKNDIIDYCYSLLEFDNKNTQDIIELISSNISDYDFNFKFDQLVNHDLSNNDLQIKKWKYLITKDGLDEITLYYFHGLLDMIDEWISVKYCDNNYPHLIQYVCKDIKLEEYNNIQKKHEEEIKQHLIWFENERHKIINFEKYPNTN